MAKLHYQLSQTKSLYFTPPPPQQHSFLRKNPFVQKLACKTELSALSASHRIFFVFSPKLFLLWLGSKNTETTERQLCRESVNIFCNYIPKFKVIGYFSPPFWQDWAPFCLVITKCIHHGWSMMPVCDELTILFPYLCIWLFSSAGESLCLPRSLSPAATVVSFHQDLGLRMLLSSRSDIIPQALAMLGPEKVNAINIQV